MGEYFNFFTMELFRPMALLAGIPGWAKVLDRRVGIPISLSVLWIEVARRAGIPIEGVSLPGHFVVRLLHGRETLLVDPFCEGMLLTVEACEDRLRQTQGDDARLSPEDLVAAGPKQTDRKKSP